MKRYTAETKVPAARQNTADRWRMCTADMWNSELSTFNVYNRLLLRLPLTVNLLRLTPFGETLNVVCPASLCSNLLQAFCTKLSTYITKKLEHLPNTSRKDIRASVPPVHAIMYTFMLYAQRAIRACTSVDHKGHKSRSGVHTRKSMPSATRPACI